MEAIYNFDLAVFKWMDANLLGSFLDKIMAFISYAGEGGIIWILAAIAMLCFKKTRRYGVMMIGSLLLMELLNNVIIKPIIARPRPFNYYDAASGFVYPNLGLFGKVPDSYSFPSGHTSSSFAAALPMLIYSKKTGIPAMILAFLMGLSRIWLHDHYCTDVLAGVVAGLIYGIIAYFIITAIFNKLEKKYDLQKAFPKK